jgi:predicted transcriptional regulator
MAQPSKNELDLEFELDTRRAVFEFIKSNPGSHMREIQRRLDMPIGLLKFHIQYLIKHEIIIEKVDRYYKRYYLSGGLGSFDRELLTVLRQDNPRRIILFLLEHPGSKHKHLLAQFELKPSTLSFYLKNLINKQILLRKRGGRESSYTLIDTERIVQVLITYRPSFLDKLVDRFLETWFDGFTDDDEAED